MQSFLNDSVKKRQFFICYAVFFLNGMLALSVGSLLPFVRDANGLDYAFCGVLVSLHSVSNLLSGFFAGMLPMAIGRKRTILLFNAFFALAYCLFSFGSGKACLVMAFFMTGLARGATSNFNNTIITNIATGNLWAINGLHAMFSTGAFLFPIFFALLTRNDASYWIYACYFMIAMGVLSWFLYSIIPVNEHKKQKTSKKMKSKLDFSFFRDTVFLLSTATLFFYLCAEQGVIGWLITYFKDTGLLRESLSQITASVLWIMILAGRITTAWLSTRVKKEKLYTMMALGFVGSFLVLIISRKLPFILAGLMGFGFSMAGIYPTTVSFAGEILKKNPLSWSFMLTIASLGSAVMPSVIGRIAKYRGIKSGMASIAAAVAVDMVLMLVLLKCMKQNKCKNY